MKKYNFDKALPFIVMLFALLNSITLIAQKKAGSVKDVDGNVYKTVSIGDQVWMAENLRTTKLNDGTAIINETDMTKWVHATAPAYCWLNNDEKMKTVYGAMYNWHAVNTGNLCPAGWRVATDDDWTKLTELLGGIEVAGGKLKDSGTGKWVSPNSGATNETGFSAIPAGYRYGYFWGQGTFYEMGLNGYYWTGTVCTDTHSWSRTMNANNTKVYRSIFVKNNGFSVRCIKGS
jgi:uncharacterized protein (TIGR02145 family)